MKWKLPVDTLVDEIITRLMPTDLILLSKAHPQLNPIIQHLVYIWQHRIPPPFSIQHDVMLDLHLVPPTISPYTPSLVALCNDHSRTLQILDLASPAITAVMPLPSIATIVTLSFAHRDRLLLSVNEDGFDLYQLVKETVSGNRSTGPVVSLVRRIAFFFDVPPNCGSYRPPGQPPIECGAVITAECSRMSTIAAAHIIAHHDATYGRVLKITTVVLITEGTITESIPRPSYITVQHEARMKVHNPNNTDDSHIALVLHATPAPPSNTFQATIAAREHPAATNMTTVLLKLSVPFPITSDIELSSDPLRLLFPPGAISEDGILLNPTQGHGGPWTIRIPLCTAPDQTDLLFCVRFAAPGRTQITVVRVDGCRVCIARRDTRTGSVLSSVRVSIAEPYEVVGVLDSEDGRFVTVVSGRDRHGHSCVVTGWYVIDVSNGGCVHANRHPHPYVHTGSDLGDGTTCSDNTAATSSDEGRFDNSFVTSSDGQLLAFLRRSEHDGTHDVLVYAAATGEVVDVVRSPARADLPLDTEWDWKSARGSGVCRQRFGSGGGMPSVMLSTTAFDTYWFSVKLLQST